MGRPPPHPTPPRSAAVQTRVRRAARARFGLSRASPACSRAAARGRRRTAPHRTAPHCAAGRARGRGPAGVCENNWGGGRERCVRQPFWGGGQAAALPCASRVGSRPFLAAGEGAGYHTVYSCGTRSSAWGEGPVRCGACKARRGRPAAILWSL